MIPFTQYLMPNGEKRETGIDRSPEVERQARVLIDGGGHFDAEVLRTGEVSLTFELDDCDEEEFPDGLVAVRVAPNGPDIGAAVDELVREAFGRLLS